MIICGPCRAPIALPRHDRPVEPRQSRLTARRKRFGRDIVPQDVEWRGWRRRGAGRSNHVVRVHDMAKQYNPCIIGETMLYL